MLTQYVYYSRLFNAHTKCAVQQRVPCPQNMYANADSLMLTYMCSTAESLVLT